MKKGRIERLFGTFQDRLVVELRLAQAGTLPQAQRVLDRFLPRYNARFSQAPAHPAPAWRPAPAQTDLDRICCYKYPRTVQRDNTVQLDGRLLQLRPGPSGRSYAGTRVDVHAHLDGTLATYYRGQRLSAKTLPPSHRSPGRPQERFGARKPYPDTPLRARGEPPTRKKNIPAADHPWRRPGPGVRRRQLHAQG